MSTTVSETQGPLDPQQSKIPADDPRLRLRNRGGRTLKKWPALAVAGALVGAILLALVFALEPAKVVDKKPEAEVETAQPVLVPEQIRAPAEPPRVHGQANAASDHAAHRPLAGSPRASNDPYSPARLRQAWHEQDWKAQNAGVLFEGAPPSVGSSAPTDNSVQRGSSTAPPESRPPATAGGSREDDPNGQGRKNDFLRAGPGSGHEDLHLVQHPRSRDQVLAGSIIPVVLITGINSDLPGPVIGQVRESVYDTASGNDLLIPQGSRLIAAYDSMIAWGQERVLLCWSRLIFPNGRSLDLECMPAGDLHGAAGLADEVDEHWWRILKGAAIASLLSATTQSVAGNAEGFNPTLPQTWARNSAEEVNNAGQQITRRNLNIQPTITIRPGFSVNLIVTKDLTIPPYRSGERSEESKQ